MIYGVSKEGIYALKKFNDNPGLGLSPVGFIDDELRNQGKQINGYPVLGTLESLESIFARDSISEVVLSRDDIPKEKLDHLSHISSFYHITPRRFQTYVEETLT